MEKYGDKTTALMEFIEKNGPLQISELTSIRGLPVRIDSTLQRLAQAGLVIESEAPSNRAQGKRFVKAYEVAAEWRELKQESEALNRKQANFERQVGRPKAVKTKPSTIRFTDVQRIKYLELGGSRWVKRMIDEADKTAL